MHGLEMGGIGRSAPGGDDRRHLPRRPHQIARVLRHAINETLQRKVNALVFVGDCMEEDIDAPSALELVPAGTLPRYEMKGQLIKKNYP